MQKLDEINTSSINAEKYAKQARNWAITSTAVSTVGLGFGIYNALRPMPRIISNQNINLLNSRPVVNRPGGGGGSPPPGGGGAGPAGNR